MASENDNDDDAKGFSLKRWSQRKLAVARERAADPAVLPLPQDGPLTSVVSAPEGAKAPEQPAEAALPPVESLTPASDFTPYMQPKVTETVRRAALKKLFADPHFNVMDGLDTYIDDYSKPDPMPVEWLQVLRSAQFIMKPPATRVNAEGHVEDVPADGDAQVQAGADNVQAPLALEAAGDSTRPAPDAVAPEKRDSAKQAR